MEELKRPNSVDVEEFFNEFVEYFGGSLVSKLIPNQNDKPNADYVFQSPEVIAELKCFRKDLFNNEEDIERLFSFFKNWKDRKLIEEGDEIKLVLGSKNLPTECYKDLINSCIKTIDRAISKANKQIRETKLTLNKPEAKGLLLLANDGNYFVQNSDFLGLICSLMQRKYLDSSIDGFVYFTLNQISFIPKSQLDWHIWAPAYRLDNDKTLGEFVNNMGSKFLNEFYTCKTGIPPTNKITTSNLEEGTEFIKQMMYIPKEIAYTKK